MIGFRLGKLGWKLSFGMLCGEWGITLETKSHTPIWVCPPLLCPLFDKQWIDMFKDETKNSRR